MSLRVQPAHAGRQRAQLLRAQIGRELRIARLAVGLTQRAVGKRAGLSQSAISQIERATRGFAIGAYSRAVAAVGHELSVRVFPKSSVSLRDRGQLELAQRIVAAVSPSWECRLEYLSPRMGFGLQTFSARAPTSCAWSRSSDRWPTSRPS